MVAELSNPSQQNLGSDLTNHSVVLLSAGGGGERGEYCR